MLDLLIAGVPYAALEEAPIELVMTWIAIVQARAEKASNDQKLQEMQLQAQVKR